MAACPGALVRQRTPSHVQADFGKTADRKQKGYRGYLLRRLVPAMTAFYDEGYLSVNDMEGLESLTPYNVTLRLAKLTTRQLESRLAHFYEGLLMVRRADVLQASLSRM